MEQSDRIDSIKEKISKAASYSDSEGNLNDVNVLAISNDINWLCEVIEKQQQEIEIYKKGLGEIHRTIQLSVNDDEDINESDALAIIESTVIDIRNDKGLLVNKR